jgi:predicted amidophosphoribosyltransferase
MPIRKINQNNCKFSVFFHGYFLSDKLTLTKKVKYRFINQEYEKIKHSHIKSNDLHKLVNNLFLQLLKVTKIYHIKYFITIPQKPDTTTNIFLISQTLINKFNDCFPQKKIQLLPQNLFNVHPYRRFYQFKFKLMERKQEIQNKITLNSHVFNQYQWHKTGVILFDDVVSTGVTMSEIGKLLCEQDSSINLVGLSYGSVYK